MILEKQKLLWDLCEKFIRDNQIDCGETINDCDLVAEKSPEFLEHIAELVGYHELACIEDITEWENEGGSV